MKKLTSEQEEELAKVELLLIQKRQRLLELARGYPGFFLAPTVVAVICFWVSISKPAHWEVFCLIWLFGLIQFHAVSISRRFNAFIELVDRGHWSTPKHPREDQTA
jgi:hypothetical protein